MITAATFDTYFATAPGSKSAALALSRVKREHNDTSVICPELKEALKLLPDYEGATNPASVTNMSQQAIGLRSEFTEDEAREALKAYENGVRTAVIIDRLNCSARTFLRLRRKCGVKKLTKNLNGQRFKENN